MTLPILSVRPIEPEDIARITNYWLTASDDFLRGMGADPAKVPSQNDWQQMLSEQINAPMNEKKAFAMIMMADGHAIGHCNINNIVRGEQAHMHLQVWTAERRKQGIGPACIKMALPYFFNNFNLKKLVCEPYALNPSPNKALAKLGFDLTGQYTGTPGWINFEQEVNVWELSKEKFESLRPE